MSLVLTPAESGLLRNVLTRNLVSISPDTSFEDVNGNQSNIPQQDSNKYSPSPARIPLASTPRHHTDAGLSRYPTYGSNSKSFNGQHSTFSDNLSNHSANNISHGSSILTPITPTIWPRLSPPMDKNQNQNRNQSSSTPILNLAKISRELNRSIYSSKSERSITAPCVSPIDEEGAPLVQVISATPTSTVDTTPSGPSIVFPSVNSAPNSTRGAKETLNESSSDLRSAFRSPVIRRSDIVFGRFIGKGGFGSVHQGFIAGRSVAIKIVMKRRGSGIHREILQAERLAYKLNLRHKNIVAILGINMCDELRGDALIIMELVTSRSLQELLDDVTRTLHRHERLRFAKEIASALQYLHSNEVAHLDIKPANVLMTSQSVCKLSDFGSMTRTSRHAAREEVEFTQLLGTLPYRAPELMQGLFPSTKADLYSYGVMLWQMVTREHPHKNENPHSLIYQVVKWNIRPSIPDAGADDEVDRGFTKLYTACWNGNPIERPTAGEVVEDLNSLQEKIS